MVYHVVMHVQNVVAVAGRHVGCVLVALHEVETHALLGKIKILDHETAADLCAEMENKKYSKYIK